MNQNPLTLGAPDGPRIHLAAVTDPTGQHDGSMEYWEVYRVLWTIWRFLNAYEDEGHALVPSVGQYYAEGRMEEPMPRTSVILGLWGRPVGQLGNQIAGNTTNVAARPEITTVEEIS